MNGLLEAKVASDTQENMISKSRRFMGHHVLAKLFGRHQD